MFVPRLGYKRTTLKTCFRNAEGLRSGAPLRIAGVEVGIVDRVEVQPEQRECPASVEFTLNTPYKLSVPNDAVAKVEQLGFLGQYYLEIDISKATGSAIQDDAVLRSEELSHHASLEIVKSLIEAGCHGQTGRRRQTREEACRQIGGLSIGPGPSVPL